MAIDEFHRDTVGMQCIGSATVNPPPGTAALPDPRSSVIIADCTIFGVDNQDRYPPDLETLVNGVDVVPRIRNLGGSGPSGPNATSINTIATKKKLYLRRMPVDPITGKSDWSLRSSYDDSNASSWGGENLLMFARPLRLLPSTERSTAIGKEETESNHLCLAHY